MWVQQGNVIKLSVSVLNPDEFKDVILYLVHFHDFMQFFSNCRKLLSNSRFEEIRQECVQWVK